MAQVKRFTAKKELRLDCGHTAKAGESFAVTAIYCCEQDRDGLLAMVRAGFLAAVAKLPKEARGDTSSQSSQR